MTERLVTPFALASSPEPEDPCVQAIIAALADGPLTATELHQRFRQSFAAQRDAVVAQLIAEGLIQRIAPTEARR